MTAFQKSEITRLRKGGVGYMKIAQTLGISENTVKSFCRRNNLAGNMSVSAGNAANSHCQHCGKRLGASTQSARRFCSDRCRSQWWHTHPEALNRKAVYQFTCAHCGAPFGAYGNSTRRYCSRACYGASRRVGDE